METVAGSVGKTPAFSININEHMDTDANITNMDAEDKLGSDAATV